MIDTGGIGLDLTVAGVVIVFAVLVIVAAMVAALRRLDDRWRAEEARSEERATTKPPTIDATTTAILAAAVATFLSGRHRIRSIRRIHSARDRLTASTWSLQGRAVLMGSHVITRHRAP